VALLVDAIERIGRHLARFVPEEPDDQQDTLAK
jgi:uncharacterized membrane protein